MTKMVKMVKIIFRDINGRRYIIEIAENEMDAIEGCFTDDEILFVYYDGQVIWCGLGKDYQLTTDELIGFFA